MKQTLAENIVRDKVRGLSDQEIGSKYNVSLRDIERVIVKETGVNISKLNTQRRIRTLNPNNFRLETSTVWSFKSRGNWATHNGNYRGNWSPYIPRNVILRYSNEGDLVLDYFCGAGTTGVECKLLNRNFIGYDINPAAIELANDNIDFERGRLLNDDPIIRFSVGDARNLEKVSDNSIDLICAHPPYADIIQYTLNNFDDLSHLSISKFLNEMKRVAKESIRILKPGHYCAILIGDMRKNKHIVPLGFKTIEVFLDLGFHLHELIIKRQHNCKTTGFWYNNSIKYNFLLLAHEYLAIFRKNKFKSIPSNKLSNDSCDVLKHEIKVKEISLETSTVWIFDRKNWLEMVYNNLIKRYSKSNCYFDDNHKVKSKTDLLITTADHIEDKYIYLDEHIQSKGILAIICDDYRTPEGYIFSSALEIFHKLNIFPYLKIKEIIIVSIEDTMPESPEQSLRITHKYILVYKKD